MAVRSAEIAAPTSSCHSRSHDVLDSDPHYRRALARDPHEILKRAACSLHHGAAPKDMHVGRYMCCGTPRQVDGQRRTTSARSCSKLDILNYYNTTAIAWRFHAARHVPKGKHVILGLISTKTPKLEPKDDLKRRIDEASKFLPLDQLCLSPQCGFASNFMGNPVTLDDEKRKLSLVVETAREVWGRP